MYLTKLYHINIYLRCVRARACVSLCMSIYVPYITLPLHYLRRLVYVVTYSVSHVRSALSHTRTHIHYQNAASRRGLLRFAVYSFVPFTPLPSHTRTHSLTT